LTQDGMLAGTPLVATNGVDGGSFKLKKLTPISAHHTFTAATVYAFHD